jgi:methylated-DNA-protein-cysteine methyltransferase-like protein
MVIMTFIINHLEFDMNNKVRGFLTLSEIDCVMEKSDRYDQIYDIVCEIPRGMVTTYGHIARSLGIRSGARLVGWALNGVANEGCRDVPAHRVVNRLGELSGKMHFETPFAMRERLEAEGVTFINDAVNLEKHLWEPPITTQSE